MGGLFVNVVSTLNGKLTSKTEWHFVTTKYIALDATGTDTISFTPSSDWTEYLVRYDICRSDNSSFGYGYDVVVPENIGGFGTLLFYPLNASAQRVKIYFNNAGASLTEISSSLQRSRIDIYAR